MIKDIARQSVFSRLTPIPDDRLAMLLHTTEIKVERSTVQDEIICCVEQELGFFVQYMSALRTDNAPGTIISMSYRGMPLDMDASDAEFEKGIIGQYMGYRVYRPSCDRRTVNYVIGQTDRSDVAIMPIRVIRSPWRRDRTTFSYKLELYI